MRIYWISGPAPGSAGRVRRVGSGFSVPDDATSTLAPPDEAVPTACLTSLLAGTQLGEATGIGAGMGQHAENVQIDREAAGHGQAMLNALSDLQLAALDGQAGPALARLATLAALRRSSADPVLDEVLQAVAARAAVEQARSE